MLLVLDNLQWCDQETLAFVTLSLTLASGSPVLVAGTLRDDSLGEDPDLASWIVAMRASGLVTEVTLDPLEAADTARLAEAILGRPLAEADADLLQATTEASRRLSSRPCAAPLIPEVPRSRPVI